MNSEQAKRAWELLLELDRGINMAHCDMGGKHKYTISHHGHEAVAHMKNFIHEILHANIDTSSGREK